MERSLPILTLKQPWASAVRDLGKDVENRSWATKHRGLIAIHAGLTPDKGARFPNVVFDSPNLKGVLFTPQPYGAIIAIARLVDVHMSTCDDLGRIRCQPADRSPGPWRLACSPWADEANYHWALEDVVPIEPFPWKGAQGLRALPEEVAEEVVRRTWPA